MRKKGKTGRNSAAGAPGKPAEGGHKPAAPDKAAKLINSLAVIAVLVLYCAMALTSAARKSTTFDEMAHLTGGVSYWKNNDYRLNPENGNLPQRWAALPLMLGEYRLPELDEPVWKNQDVWGIGELFFHRLGNDLDGMLLKGRFMIVLLGAALGVVVYLWSRRLFGPVGGWISLLVTLLSPSILAHSRLVTSDLTAALLFTCSMGCLWLVLHRVTPLRLAGSCLAMGALFVSKMSAVLIIPMGLLLAVIRVIVNRPMTVAFGRARQVESRDGQVLAVAALAAAHAAAVIVIVWASYGFRYAGLNRRKSSFGGYQIPWARLLEGRSRPLKMIGFARDHKLLPEAYLYGFAHVYESSRVRSAFLNGRHSIEGWWYFFPYCFLVKTPIPLFVLLGLAAAGTIRRRRAGKAEPRAGPPRPLGGGLYDTAPWWVLLAAYWAFSVTSSLNIGHRHVLPTYPAMFILAGAAARWFARPRRVLLPVLVVASMLAFAGESLRIWPNYLAYFNQLAGGPGNGYRHLVDSSLDWGQDLRQLKRRLERKGLSDGPGHRVYLSYFGTGSPSYYGIRATQLPSFFDKYRQKRFDPLSGGVYCISATMLQAVYLPAAPGRWSSRHEQAYQKWRPVAEAFYQTRADPAARQELIRRRGLAFWRRLMPAFEQLQFARLCAFLRRREPDESVGHSILIYRLTDDDVAQALLGPAGERGAP